MGVNVNKKKRLTKLTRPTPTNNVRELNRSCRAKRRRTDGRRRRRVPNRARRTLGVERRIAAIPTPAETRPLQRVCSLRHHGQYLPKHIPEHVRRICNRLQPSGLFSFSQLSRSSTRAHANCRVLSPRYATPSLSRPVPGSVPIVLPSPTTPRSRPSNEHTRYYGRLANIIEIWIKRFGLLSFLSLLNM